MLHPKKKIPPTFYIPAWRGEKRNPQSFRVERGLAVGKNNTSPAARKKGTGTLLKTSLGGLQAIDFNRDNHHLPRRSLWSWPSTREGHATNHEEPARQFSLSYLGGKSPTLCSTAWIFMWTGQCVLSSAQQGRGRRCQGWCQPIWESPDLLETQEYSNYTSHKEQSEKN